MIQPTGQSSGGHLAVSVHFVK